MAGKGRDMKSIKTLCLTAIATGLLIAIAHAGSASATVLCTTTSTPCNNAWGQNTEIESSLEPGKKSEIKDTNGNLLDQCSKSSLKITTKTTGSAVTTVEATTPTLAWSECTSPTKTVTLAILEIHHIATTDNGTLTAKSLQVTFNSVLLGSCTYGLGATFVDIGTFTGGSVPAFTPPIIDINTVLNKEAGASSCPTTARWTAVFEVSSPSGFGMYVEPS
jgi:hypothetical protein